VKAFLVPRSGLNVLVLTLLRPLASWYDRCWFGEPTAAEREEKAFRTPSVGTRSTLFGGGGASMAEPNSQREQLYLSPGLDARTRFYSEADGAVIGSIQCGVLFVMAFWSGPARLAFAELKRVLERVDQGGRLELVVVDTDGCPELYELPEFVGKLAGAGETAWVRDGRIVRTSGQGYHPECFESYTRQLLNDCVAEP
jgi:hypothetical protein